MTKAKMRQWLNNHGWQVTTSLQTGNIFIKKDGRTERYTSVTAAYTAKHG